MRRLMLIGLLLGLWFTATGCETIKGIGRDITNAGEAVEDAVR